MSYQTRISNAFADGFSLPLHPASKYVLFSDCHRGVGNANDNFLKNEYLYLAALRYYFRKGFTYIELGDGDELWENRSIQKIKEAHIPSFSLLAKFSSQQRFYGIYGNHDHSKKNTRFQEKYLRTYYCSQMCCTYPLFPKATFHAGIILRDCQQKKDLYLTHGHQADFLNGPLWPLSRFLVRYLWKPLEKLGIPDPTSAAKNNRKKKTSEKRLARWALENHCFLISGHTHHPMMGSVSSPYFNTGSCVHPAGITCIEISNRRLFLVKWSLDSRTDLSLYASREILGEPLCLDDEE